jgi:hypothetical protein
LLLPIALSAQKIRIADYYPLRVGNRWIYKAPPDKPDYVSRIEKGETVGTVRHYDATNAAKILRFEPKKGIRYEGEIFNDGSKVIFEKPFYWFPDRMKKDDSLYVSTPYRKYETNGRTEGTFTISQKIVGFEDVTTTEEKSYKKCLRVDFNTHWTFADGRQAKSINIYHFAKDIGAVKAAARLPKAVAAQLKQPPETGKAVTRLVQKKKRVEIYCADGSRYVARAIICTIPFTALRKVRIEAPISDLQRDAIQNMPYIPISQVHMRPLVPFWEQDKMPAAMWTDSPLGRIFAIYNKKGEIERLIAWMVGKEAIKFNKLPQEEAKKFVLAEMEKIRPTSKNNLEIMYVNSWSNNPFQGGAYHQYAPGQISRWTLHFAKSIGNICFAGEHTCFTHTGMEGAAQSAERAVSDIIQMLNS